MAESTSNFFDPLYSFIFDSGGGSRKSGALTYDELQTRRKLALALATRNRKFPTNIGEGLTYLGESLAERRDKQEYEAAEAAQRQQDMQFRQGLPPGGQSGVDPAVAPAAAPAPATGRMPAPPLRAEAEDTMPVQQASLQPGATSIDDWMARVKRNESGGAKGDPYQLVGPRSRRGDYPYGAYQVMGENIPAWTKTHLGTEMTPDQFLADPKAQDAVARAQGQQYINTFGPQGAAAAWFAGPNWQQKSAARDVLGTNISEYQRRFNLPMARDQIAGSLANQGGMGEADARLQDVVGVQPQPRTQLAAAPRNEPVVSDAPAIGTLETGVAQSVQQRRDDIARSVAGQQTPAPQSVAPPQPGAVPAQQIAQAPQQRIPQAPMSYPGAEKVFGPLRSEPQPPRMSQPTAEENYLRNPPPTVSDRVREDALLRAKQLEQQRKDTYTQQHEQFKLDKQAWDEDRRKYMDYEAGDPKRRLDLETAEQGLKTARNKEAYEQRLGGAGMLDFHQKRIDESAKAAAPIPGAMVALNNAKAAIDQGIFTGMGADQKVVAEKFLGLLGFPVDPRVSHTEQLKAYIMPVVAAARQAQSGGANISDNDMLLALRAAAGDVRLEEGTIRQVLGSLERMNLGIALDHQTKVGALAQAATGGDPAAMETFFKLQGLPMEQIVPKGAVAQLLKEPSPAAVAEFDEAFKTPGLAARIIARRR